MDSTSDDQADWQTVGWNRRGLRGRRGGLRNMPHMPLDILVEVFSFMHPRDLLNLARTTRDFRTFLFRRSSAPFWKAARKNVEGLPDCPQYLSEPAYANLMFFAHCHNCLRSNIQNILFEFSARYCRDCQRYLFMEGGEVDYDLDHIVAQSGFPAEYLTSVTISRDSTDKTYFLRCEYESFWDACKRANDDAELVAVIADQVAFVAMIHESCGALYAWKEAQVQDRAQELERLRGERLDAITSYLSAEGWADEINRMGGEELDLLAEKPYARKPAKLTPRGWMSIRDDAHAFMEDVRFDRLQRERHQLLFDRFCTLAAVLDDPKPESSAGAKKRLPEDDLRPQFADYALLSEIRGELDDPGDAMVPAERLARVWEEQDAVVEQWKRTIEGELITKLHAALTLPDDINNPLNLAIALFTCGGCYRDIPLRYPGLLSHPCLRQERFHYQNNELYEATLEEFASSIDSRPALKVDTITVNPETIRRLTEIIKAFGLDPFHATQDDLDRCGRRMYCAYTKCQIERNGVLYLTGCDWLSALHHMNEHEIGRPCEFRILGERETTRLREIEGGARGLSDGMENDHGSMHRACSLCPTSHMSWYSMTNHLRFAHGVDIKGNLEGSFYVPLDEQLRQLPKIYVCCDPGSRQFRGMVLQKGRQFQELRRG